MMKLLAFSPHFDCPALYPQALAGFPELITLAEVDKDGFHHTCWAPSFFVPWGCWCGRPDGEDAALVLHKAAPVPLATPQCIQSLL